jgi:hypothetical protein
MSKHKWNLDLAIEELTRHGFIVHKFSWCHWRIDDGFMKVDIWPTSGRWGKYRQVTLNGTFVEFVFWLYHLRSQKPPDTLVSVQKII